jgi:hypothetical protein
MNDPLVNKFFLAYNPADRQRPTQEVMWIGRVIARIPMSRLTKEEVYLIEVQGSDGALKVEIGDPYRVQFLMLLSGMLSHGFEFFDSGQAAIAYYSHRFGLKTGRLKVWDEGESDDSDS